MVIRRELVTDKFKGRLDARQCYVRAPKKGSGCIIQLLWSRDEKGWTIPRLACRLLPQRPPFAATRRTDAFSNARLRSPFALFVFLSFDIALLRQPKSDTKDLARIKCVFFMRPNNCFSLSYWRSLTPSWQMSVNKNSISYRFLKKKIIFITWTCAPTPAGVSNIVPSETFLLFQVPIF